MSCHNMLSHCSVTVFNDVVSGVLVPGVLLLLLLTD